MTSVVAIRRHLGLFQEGIDCGFALTLLFDDVVGNINRPFRFAVIGEVAPLVFGHQTDVAPQFAVHTGRFFNVKRLNIIFCAPKCAPNGPKRLACDKNVPCIRLNNTGVGAAFIKGM